MAVSGLEMAAGDKERRVIHSLRRAHWRWMVILAITLPLLLLAFLGSRDFSRHDSSLPDEVIRSVEGSDSGAP